MVVVPTKTSNVRGETGSTSPGVSQRIISIGHKKQKLFQMCRAIPPLRRKRKDALFNGESVGFVPTMGALHEGHFALIRQAAAENKQVYVSIYVNPTQFGVNEDLASYPRDLPQDLDKLAVLATELNQDARMGRLTTVFAPKTKDMYPNHPPTSEIDGHGSFVTITPLSSILEGASRPVFFRGVATVVMKLLNIVQPERIYLGQKDIQQTYVVRRMVEDFQLDTQVRVCYTVREPDGLALSSRNVYLGSRRRAVATVLLRALAKVQDVYVIGKRKREDLLAAAFEVVNATQAIQQDLPPKERTLFEVDYFSLADPKSMEEISEVEPGDGAILSGAIKMLPIEDPQEGEDTGLGGGITTVRLIDNIRLQLISLKLGPTVGGYYELQEPGRSRPKGRDLVRKFFYAQSNDESARSSVSKGPSKSDQ